MAQWLRFNEASLRAGLYGYCAPEAPVPGEPGHASSYCVFDNDFAALRADTPDAGVNVADLLVARGAVRLREVAVRRARDRRTRATGGAGTPVAVTAGAGCAWTSAPATCRASAPATPSNRSARR